MFTPEPPNVTSLSGNAFFVNVPGILLPGETYEGPLFRIALSNASSTTNYTGSITFLVDAAASPTAADSADWDHDSLSNLLEYALGLDA